MSRAGFDAASGIPSQRRTSLFRGASSESGDELLFTSVVLHWLWKKSTGWKSPATSAARRCSIRPSQTSPPPADADKNERNFGLLEEAATASRISVERGL
jgi:hypothetical protein